MADDQDAPRRFLVRVQGVLEVDAPDSDAAYRLAEAWISETGQQARAATKAETGNVRVRWLRTEPDSDEFPGWHEDR